MKSINLDITFCAATKCNRQIKSQCGRCIDRFTEWQSELPEDKFVKSISIADFSSKEGNVQDEKCTRFFKKHEGEK